MTIPDEYVPALGYRWLTPLYDWVVRWTTRDRIFKHALLAQAGLHPHQRILDLACGTGTMTVWAKQSMPGAEIHGVDGDPDILVRARKKAHAAGVSIDFQPGYADQLPFPDASFDRILSAAIWNGVKHLFGGRVEYIDSFAIAAGDPLAVNVHWFHRDSLL